MGTSKRATRKQLTAKQAGVKHGWRSGLEELVGKQLDDLGVAYEYEKLTIHYTVPARKAKYTPDFEILSNGIIVETKGLWTVQDRQKHLLVRQQNPLLDIRMVFSNPRQRISKASKTTYANWCDKHGILWAAKLIPEEWIHEQKPS
jgi:hypothetical protein